MKVHQLADLSPKARLALTRRSSAMDPAASESAKRVCESVKAEGDSAVVRFTAEYDKVDLKAIAVQPADIEKAAADSDKDVREAIRLAIRNVRAFHRTQGYLLGSVETMPGVRCWRESRPLKSVGLYVPAGSAPLPSTLIMLAVPALIAGCEEIVVCSPPRRSGLADPLVLTAAYELGLKTVFSVGGIQAIAAMAYGTETIPRVNKVFGPGNEFVTAAKQYVSTDPTGAATDFPAGPSELLVLADSSANPRFVAADLISQAEHDPRAHVILVTTDEACARETLRFIDETVPSFERRNIIQQSLAGSLVVVASTLDEAIRFANEYAPEHLSIQTAAPEEAVRSIFNAGSVFLGPWSPVTAGDYASGTNHTLPTAGWAASYGGVTVESFCKLISFQRLTKDGLRALRPTLTTLSTAEGLTAHREAVEIRLR